MWWINIPIASSKFEYTHRDVIAIAVIATHICTRTPIWTHFHYSVRNSFIRNNFLIKCVNFLSVRPSLRQYGISTHTFFFVVVLTSISNEDIKGERTPEKRVSSWVSERASECASECQANGIKVKDSIKCAFIRDVDRNTRGWWIT